MEENLIPLSQVLKPQFKDFNNFREYVEFLDKKYKGRDGMVKIIPPKEWIPHMTNYQKKLQSLIVHSPIEQNAFGKGGIYQCLHIPKKSVSYEQYQSKARQLDKITDGKSVEEVQSMVTIQSYNLQFWKNVAFSPPLYGADILNTLMDDKSKGWNLNKLDSVLMDSLSDKVKGVNTPYCYVGSWKALFCWHTEDLDLSAINFVHFGKPKFWYAIHHEDRHIIESQAKRIFGEHFAACNQFLRHKTIIINPYYLKKKYPQLRISKMIQYENEFILVFGGSYHTGFNFGFNLAEAVNYGTLDWLRQLPEAKSCRCMSKSVKASIYQIYSNLSKNSNISKTKQFQQFQQHVFQLAQKEQSQQQFAEVKKRVKDLWSKKIKKSHRHPKKIIYKDEQYEIDSWVQCDKCNTWRKLSLHQQKLLDKDQKVKGIRKTASAYIDCKKLNKQCYKKDKIDKQLFTLNITN